MMRAGELRHRIVIKEITYKDDEMGQPEKSTSTHATVWAHIEPLRGREFWNAQQAQSEATHRITIRRLDSVKPTMQVEYGDRQFTIDTILHPGETETHLLVVESLG